MTGKHYKQLITYTERLADAAYRFCTQLNNVESRLDKVEFASVTRSLEYAKEMLKSSSSYLYKTHETTTVLLLEKTVDFLYALKPRIVALADAANAGKEDKDAIDFTILLTDLDHFVGRIRNILCSAYDDLGKPASPSMLPMKKFDNVESMEKHYAGRTASSKDWNGALSTLEKTLDILGHRDVFLTGGKHSYIDAYKKVTNLFVERGWKLSVAGPLVVFWAELPDGVRAIDFTSWEDAGSKIRGNGANIPTMLKKD